MECGNTACAAVPVPSSARYSLPVICTQQPKTQPTSPFTFSVATALSLIASVPCLLSLQPSLTSLSMNFKIVFATLPCNSSKPNIGLRQQSSFHQRVHGANHNSRHCVFLAHAPGPRLNPREEIIMQTLHPTTGGVVQFVQLAQL